jgi:glycosyltransferase involved in cell wall biosynthesis
MKILIVNKFIYPKGGDAVSALQTGALLARKGHSVEYWGMEHPDNPDYKHKDLFMPLVDFNSTPALKQKLKLLANILYSFEAKRKIKQLFEREKPDLVHLNNFAHQLSPSIVDAAHDYGIPMVMTMHDFKMVCPSYSMLAQGKPCEACGNKKYYHCFLKKCFKDSRLISAVATLEMYLHHRVLHVYDKIRRFIAPSRFMQNKLQQMGFSRPVTHLPNFIELEKYQPAFEPQERSVVYLGRLSPEKGLFTLLEAVKGLDLTLKIIGTGPLEAELKSKTAAGAISNVRFLGYKTGVDLHDEIRKAMFLILPSECYENNPLSILEAFALGKPAIGSRIGGIPELVVHGKTGYVFQPGNAGELKESIVKLSNAPGLIQDFGHAAHQSVQQANNSELYYQQLSEVYEAAMHES